MSVRVAVGIIGVFVAVGVGVSLGAVVEVGVGGIISVAVRVGDGDGV